MWFCIEGVGRPGMAVAVESELVYELFHAHQSVSNGE